MSKKNGEKEEIKPKLVAFLKSQKATCQTKDLLKGLNLSNTPSHRKLVREAARELKASGVHVSREDNKRLHYWIGEKPPAPKPNKKEKPKTEEA